VLRIAERRYAVRADQVGRRMKFEEIHGVGRMRLGLSSLAEGARVTQLDVMMVGDDGSAYSLAGDLAAVVPVGRYAVGAVTLAVLDGKSPHPWNFVFSRSGGEAPQRWYEVREDSETVVDLVGRFRFELNVKGDCRTGAELSISPRLFTGDGLLINSSSCGETDRFAAHDDNYNCASIQLVSPGEKLLGSTRSGFT
jgi:hypothetical protein